MSYVTERGYDNPKNFYRGGVHVGTFYQEWSWDPGPKLVGTGHTPYGIDLEIFQGKVLKDFHKRRNEGELMPYTEYLRFSQHHSGSGTYHTINSSNGDEILVYGPGPFYTYGDGITSGEFSFVYNDLRDHGVDLSVYVQQAASKLYSRGWDGLTFLAELHQVVKMFRGVLKSAIKLALDPKGIFNAWLEGRYGWRVLVKDIQDINQLISEFDDEQRSRNKERSGDSLDWVNDYSAYREVGSSYQTRTDTQSVSVQVRGSVIADFVPNRISLNPIVTAWELVTLSFVIDWFWSVGRALEAISFMAATHKYTSCGGVHYIAVREMNLDAVLKGTLTGTIDAESTEVIEAYWRHPFAVPYLPSFNVNLDGFKVLDLVALLIQRMK